MATCTCVICESEFVARTPFALVCSAKCRMRRYRATDKGKRMYTEYNKKHYKRTKCYKVK